MKKHVGVREILTLIPDELLSDLAAQTGVDKYVKKLDGRSVFQLFLYSFFMDDKLSLRSLSKSFGDSSFRILNGSALVDQKTAKSSISDRLRTIKVEYFAKIFEHLVERYQKVLPKDLKENVVRFDSTTLTLSSKLLKEGFPARQTNPDKAVKNQIKFAIGFNQIPTAMKLFTKSSETEEVALRQVVLAHKYEPDSIAVFDRGLASRSTLCEIEQSGIDFVTRLSDKANYRVIENNGSVLGQKTGNLTLVDDVIVQLRSKRTHWVQHPFRLIIAHNEEGKKLFFLTNRRDLSAIEICEIYKKRWDIEVFFKFIKQELHAKHFLSRNLNGIQVTFYMILILSLLLMAFKHLNNLDGYQWVRWDFRKELRDLVNRDLVYLFDGNLEKYDRHFFGLSTS